MYKLCLKFMISGKPKRTITILDKDKTQICKDFLSRIKKKPNTEPRMWRFIEGSYFYEFLPFSQFDLENL